MGRSDMDRAASPSAALDAMPSRCELTSGVRLRVPVALPKLGTRLCLTLAGEPAICSTLPALVAPDPDDDLTD